MANNKIHEMLCILGFECKSKINNIFYHKNFTIPFDFSKCNYLLDITNVIYEAGQNNSAKYEDLEPIIKHFQE